MAVRGISHLEFYTNSAREDLAWLSSSMGFTRVADAVEVDRSSVLLHQGDVWLVVTSGWATSRFLAQQVGSVADVALLCDDVRGTAAKAKKCGARVLCSPQGQCLVQAYGVNHTLVPVSRNGLFWSMAGRRWVAAASPVPAVEHGIRRFAGVDVLLTGDLAYGYSFLCQRAFGLQRSAEEDGRSESFHIVAQQSPVLRVIRPHPDAAEYSDPQVRRVRLATDHDAAPAVTGMKLTFSFERTTSPSGPVDLAYAATDRECSQTQGVVAGPTSISPSAIYGDGTPC